MLRVKSICKEKGITLKELAELMEVTPEAVTRMLSKNGNPTLSSLIKISSALDVEIWELFNPVNDINQVRGYLEIGNTIYRINNLVDLRAIYESIKSNK